MSELEVMVRSSGDEARAMEPAPLSAPVTDHSLTGG